MIRAFLKPIYDSLCVILSEYYDSKGRKLASSKGHGISSNGLCNTQYLHSNFEHKFYIETDDDLYFMKML